MLGSKKIYREIYRKIKKYDEIVIARHIGPDPDALASQLALKEMILNTFKGKRVYAVGLPSSKFHYLGTLDKVEIQYAKTLFIVVDTPDKKRVDGIENFSFADSIKIDHHPFIEKFTKTEWIDDTASSVSQMIVELSLHTKLKLTKEAAEKLYIGIVADTNRFMFAYTTSKTLNYAAYLLNTFHLDLPKLYEKTYIRPYREVKFQGYIESNLTVTEHGLAYIQITNEILKEYGVDAATAGNMINNFNYIEEIIVWAFFTEDVRHDNIRGSIRSRGPIINDVASQFHGGGHIYASGVKLTVEEDVQKLIQSLDERCMEYQNEIIES